MQRMSQLALKPDFEEAARRCAAFWAGEVLDRPCVSVTVHEQDGPGSPSYRQKWEEPEAAVQRAAEHLRSVRWLGEAMPYASPDLGPDQFAAWLGAELRFSPDSANTNWVEPFVDDWEAAMPLRIEGDSPAWRKTLSLMDSLAEAGDGRFMVGMLDLHGNFDALSAIRGPDRLALDFYDCPDVLREAARQVGQLFAPAFRRLEEAGRMPETGYVGWLNAYSPTRFAVTQCDFACMVSPQMFRDYILPELEREWAFLEHAIYHYDGVVALQHLDDLLAEPDLDAIQWVPGAGEKPAYLWDELLLRMIEAGKGVIVHAPGEHVRRLHEVLGPERVFYQTSCETVSEAEELLGWLSRNT
ncbi:MAG: hypothetical protein ACOC7T_03715 [Planctomycetota bacterium]